MSWPKSKDWSNVWDFFNTKNDEKVDEVYLASNTKIKVFLIKDRFNRIISIVDKDKKKYVTIRYRGKSNVILFYEDCTGAWYDAKYFSFACPYNIDKFYSRWCFPEIKKVQSRTIASELVEVRPMEQPRGLLLYMEYNNE